jgi:alkylhydroperoxidase family enzyme
MPVIEPMPRDELEPGVRERLAAMAAPIAASNYPLVLAWNPAALEAFMADPPGQDGLLGFELREALRIRSAQLGGCDSCQVAQYDPSIDAGSVACMVDPGGAGDPRQRLAMEFMRRMHLDHLSIDAAFYRELGEVFTVPEILELGLLCAQFVGGHRFVHTLDMFGTDPPVFAYRRSVAAG